MCRSSGYVTITSIVHSKTRALAEQKLAISAGWRYKKGLFAVDTKFLSRNGAGRSQRQRIDQLGRLGKLLFCLLLAGSFMLGQAPSQLVRAASFTVGCGDTAGLIGAIQSANAAEGADA